MRSETTNDANFDAKVIPFPAGGRSSGDRVASVIEHLCALHDEASRHFCKAAERFIEIWQDENLDASVTAPSLRKGCCRLQMAEELSRLEAFCRSHTAREEQLLRAAGMRHFPHAWAAHKSSHARFLKRIERRVRRSAHESPGALARHDQLALSLLALRSSGRGEAAATDPCVRDSAALPRQRCSGSA